MRWLFIALWAAAPLYVWRFTLLGLPTNFLMLFVFLVLAVVVTVAWRKDHLARFIVSWKELPKPVKFFGVAFIFATTLAFFIGGISFEKFGQWLVLYFQPITTALFLYAYLIEGDDWRIKVTHLMYLLVGLAGWLAIFQYFTLWTLPVAYVGNPVEPKRAIAFWSHPNGFGLFVVPILAWLLPDLAKRFSNLLEQFNRHDFWALVCWVFGAVGILLSLSRGAWIGLAVAVFAGVFLFGSRKFKLAGLLVIIAMSLVIYLIPSLNHRILSPFAGEKSAESRLSLWKAGLNGVVDAPLFGKGINGFSENWSNYNEDNTVTHHNFPHNIFLDLWVDTGLLGMLSFAGLCLYLMHRGFVNRSDVYAVGFTLFLLAMLAHGMIDNPYFKNDLALIFWLMLAFSLVPIKYAPESVESNE